MVTKSIMTVFNRLGLITVVFAMATSGAMVKADVVAVVSTQSSITSLSMAQVADLFLGRERRFASGLQALPIDQPEGSAVRDEFYSKIAGKTAVQIKAYWSKIIFTGRGQPPPTVSSDTEMKKRITENPGAIGYIDRNMVDGSVRVVF